MEPCPRCRQPKLIGIRLYVDCAESKLPSVRAQQLPGDLLRNLDIVAEEALAFDEGGSGAASCPLRAYS